MEMDIQAAQALLKQKKAELESLEERLQTQEVLEQMPMGVVMFDHHRKLYFANRIARELAGGQEDLGLNQFMEALKSKGKTSGNHLKNTDIEKVLKTGKTTHYYAIPVNGSEYEITVMPLINYEDEVYGGAILLHDVTHYKNVEAIKNEFISLASHQLRNPANQIGWYAEMLEDTGGLNKEQRKYLKLIRQGVNRMSKIVRNLLNVSRLESGRLRVEPKMTDLNVMIKKVIEEFDEMKTDLGCKITFSQKGRKNIKVSVDESLLSEVLKNLINNAMNYSEKGHCEIEIYLYKEENDGYIVRISDQGIGIPEKDQENIFKKFFRAENAPSRSSAGTGLGLYLAKIIIEASGGKIWFESKENVGTSFYVKIPAKGMKLIRGEKRLT